ncbi:sulfite exporter TauE/SafE family protein [Lampropedia puyangensis]|uniref:Probable membrane transporter protein n=1 Tax=Lampropedia puyangensis TaxID=1330072 RepID=A0A4S8EVX8_9BURK|nr:TSUP family transporter [Lampropedia puyangensis]THT98658.1 sulfite exporter TauE/SafE family protein [Lampropedia puyangensis]
MEWIIVSLASLFAGFVDAIVGGGGLVLVPALFAVYPSAVPATLLGTNKSGSIWGTSFAAWKYAKRVQFRWRTLVPAIAAAFVGSMLGAWALTQISADFLRKALPFILLAVLVYTLARKDMGQNNQPIANPHKEIALGMLIGLLIGFYDGFFGPGTGSFLVFAFVRILGFDFLNASANAKLLNIATNFAALLLLGWKGHIWWHLAIPLALSNIIGSFLGTAMALRYGSGFVRWMFIAVVTVLIARSAWDGFFS